MLEKLNVREPVEKAANLTQKEAGQHFDPALSKTFLDNLLEIFKIKEKYVETSVLTIAGMNHLGLNRLKSFWIVG